VATSAETVTVRDLEKIDEALAAEMLRCWVDVSNAGGAVGFVPPVTAQDVRPLVDAMVGAVERGDELLVVLEVDGSLAGFAVIKLSRSPLIRHYGHVVRVQIHPDLHGRGLGRDLMEGVRKRAVRAGLEGLTLDVRGGTGTDAFYARLGYLEVGRIPGAVRVADWDDRDSISMFLRL
jgi:ribosomal protein S18 acetylase RimI-like enzyme